VKIKIIVSIILLLAGMFACFLLGVKVHRNNAKQQTINETIAINLDQNVSIGFWEKNNAQIIAISEFDFEFLSIAQADDIYLRKRNIKDGNLVSMNYVKDKELILQINNLIAVDYNADYIIDYRHILPDKKEIFLDGIWQAVDSENDIPRFVRLKASGKPAVFNEDKWNVQ